MGRHPGKPVLLGCDGNASLPPLAGLQTGAAALGSWGTHAERGQLLLGMLEHFELQALNTWSDGDGQWTHESYNGGSTRQIDFRAELCISECNHCKVGKHVSVRWQ